MSKFYCKEKIIGSGTFGNVWLVKSKISNNSFVLKEVNLTSMNATETQQALTEVTVLSRCRHRNIIKYKDAVIDHKKGMLSIIMEYADGGDLYSTIVKQRGVPFKEHIVISWFTQICLALQYIHHKGVIHRDLKTRNVFLTRGRQVKVGDFGIARSLNETNELATTAIGTPYYLSPEICNRKPYNHKSDMWAVGCILFEMAALSHPFQAHNFAHLLTLIVTGRRSELPRYCSSLIKELVQKLLDENPETRPSADDILALPSLQPYLSEMWVKQNSNNSSCVSRLADQEANYRRHSLCDNAKNSNGTPPKRRASISSVESRGIKTRFGFIGKSKTTQTSKLATSSRSHSVKVRKNSPKRCAVKNDQFLTYKVLNPMTLKEKLSNILFNGLKQPQAENDSEKYNGKYHEMPSESDCGYQSREHLEKISVKANNFGSGSLMDEPRTSTKRNIDVSNFHIEESVVDDVFDSSTIKRRQNPSSPRIVNKTNHSGCSHSHCQQCMLDILWRNRIRGRIGPMMKTDERTELIRKLEVVFGRDFFDTVYTVLVSNWENCEHADTPKALRDITHSLNYSQLQHLPLMMQLIQLDLVRN